MKKEPDHHGQDETPDVSDIANVDVSHEESDVNVGMLVKFIVGLFISTVIILVAMKLMMDYFQRRQIAEELPPASRVNPPGTRRLPPMPRLQGAPGSELLPLDDLKKFREEQQTAINGYAWVDRATGTVRMPIEVAKALIIERGLQVKAPAAAPSPSVAAPLPPKPTSKPKAASASGVR